MSLHTRKTRRTLATARAPPPRSSFARNVAAGGKTFRIDHPFDFAAGLITVPIRPNRFLESAVGDTHNPQFDNYNQVLRMAIHRCLAVASELESRERLIL